MVVTSMHLVSAQLCGRKGHIWRMQQLVHLTQNSQKFLQTREDKACLLFQPWWCIAGVENHILKCRKKERRKADVMVVFQAMWGVAEEITRRQALSTVTCSSPCWISPSCLQAVLNTTLSAPPDPSLGSTQKPEEQQCPIGLTKGNVGLGSFWHEAHPGRWAALMKQHNKSELSADLPSNFTEIKFEWGLQIQVVFRLED